jgi:hypothetical protein
MSTPCEKLVEALKARVYNESRNELISMDTLFMLGEKTVISKGPDSLWIVCTRPEDSYFSEITRIKVDDEGGFQMRVRLCNCKTWKITYLWLRIPGHKPWYIHGYPLNIAKQVPSTAVRSNDRIYLWLDE